MVVFKRGLYAYVPTIQLIYYYHIFTEELDTPNPNHYQNTPIQYNDTFYGCKNEKFQMKKLNLFVIFARNRDCGYSLEPPHRGGSNEYPQSMFYSRNKKKKCIPLQTPFFFYIKVGFEGVKFT